jgi:hypothetical protein
LTQNFFVFFENLVFLQSLRKIITKLMFVFVFVMICSALFQPCKLVTLNACLTTSVEEPDPSLCTFNFESVSGRQTYPDYVATLSSTTLFHTNSIPVWWKLQNRLCPFKIIFNGKEGQIYSTLSERMCRICTIARI